MNAASFDKFNRLTSEASQYVLIIFLAGVTLYFISLSASVPLPVALACGLPMVLFFAASFSSHFKKSAKNNISYEVRDNEFVINGDRLAFKGVLFAVFTKKGAFEGKAEQEAKRAMSKIATREMTVRDGLIVDFHYSSLNLIPMQVNSFSENSEPAFLEQAFKRFPGYSVVLLVCDGFIDGVIIPPELMPSFEERVRTSFGEKMAFLDC